MKQINLNSVNWRNLTSHLLTIIATVIICWFIRNCHGEHRSQITVKTPEIHGEFKAVKPEQTPLTKKETVIIRQNLSKKENEFLQQQIDLLLSENDKLKQAFVDAPDSTKIKMYEDCVQLKSFAHTWDNDTINATASGIVRGEIQDIALKWKVKPFEVKVPQPKQTIFRLLAGGGMGLNKELNQASYKLNLGYQNSKGNIILGSYQQIGSNKFYLLDYNFSLWNFNK